MRTDFDRLAEGSYFLHYEIEQQSQQYERELLSILKELPQDFSVHFSANGRYHDWYVGDFRWNRLANEASLTLFPPMTHQQLNETRDKRRFITLTFLGVTAVEVTSAKAYAEVTPPSTVYMAGFEKGCCTTSGRWKRPHSYVCTIQLFDTERLKIGFSKLCFHAS